MFCQGYFPLSSTAIWHLGWMVGWKGILRSRNKFDGMGQKSGRNGTPVPKSRVSLSESEPGVTFSSLGLPAESLACFSGFAVHLSASLCSRVFFARSRESPRHAFARQARFVANPAVMRSAERKRGLLCRRFLNLYGWVEKELSRRPSRLR